MELIAALGVLVVVISAFSVSLSGLMTYEQTLQHETEAIVVLNNTLERLEASGKRTLAVTDRLLQEEFNRSDLSHQTGLHAECREEAGSIGMTILKKNGRPVAKVELARHE